MSDIPLSDITIIAAALGIFFLIVAFYKSIFHKRKAPHQTVLPPQKKVAAAATDDNHPVKMIDPFQQIPVDNIPHNKIPANKPASTFYPAYPESAETTAVSAFRQFSPHQDFATTPAAAKNETSYEWE